MNARHPRRRLVWVIAVIALLAAWWLWRRAARMHAVSTRVTPVPVNAIHADAGPEHAGPPAPRSPAHAVNLTSATGSDDGASEFGAFEGRVLSTGTDRGVPQATITFTHRGLARTVSSDASGAFVFGASEPGRYELTLVSAPGYLEFAPEVGNSPVVLVAVPRARVRNVVLFLTPRVAYTAVVSGPDGEPVAGAVIRALDPPIALTAGAATVTTNAQGEAVLNAPDGALLQATREGFAPARAPVDFSAQATHRIVFRLARLADGGAVLAGIAGVVLDPSGQPADSALIVLHSNASTTGDPERRLRASAATGVDGRFVVVGLDPGEYTVLARQSPFAPVVVESVRTGTSDLTIRLARGSALRGEIHDAQTRAAIAGFSVIVTERRGEIENGLSRVSTMFDTLGRYEVLGLAPGAYTVTAVASGYALSDPVVVTIGDDGADAARTDFALTRGGRLSGEVRDAETQAPLAGAHVSLEGMVPPTDSPVPLIANAECDATGRFTLSGLGSTAFSITAIAEGHHSRVVSNLTADANGNGAPVIVALTPLRRGENPGLEFEGIGAVLTARVNGLVIADVVAGGGATEAGLVAGDAIVSVDGVPATALGFSGALQRIRGPEGSVVVLGVRRGGAGNVVAVAVTRRRLRT